MQECSANPLDIDEVDFASDHPTNEGIALLLNQHKESYNAKIQNENLPKQLNELQNIKEWGETNPLKQKKGIKLERSSSLFINREKANEMRNLHQGHHTSKDENFIQYGKNEIRRQSLSCNEKISLKNLEKHNDEVIRRKSLPFECSPRPFPRVRFYALQNQTKSTRKNCDSGIYDEEEIDNNPLTNTKIEK